MNILSLIVLISGVIAVFLASRGSILTFLFGLIQVLGYSYLTFKEGLYGEMALNLLVFLPAQLLAIYSWTRNYDSKNVVPRTLQKKHKYIWLIVIALSLFLYWNLIPFINADGSRSIGNLTVVISIFAQLFMVLRLKEQWILWIFSNILNITLWLDVLSKNVNESSLAMVLMWMIYFIINIYGFFNWWKLEKKSRKSNL